MRTLLERLEADGVTIVERNDEAAYTAFKCLDPDGHRIEVYWEPALPLMLRNRKAGAVTEAPGTRHLC